MATTLVLTGLTLVLVIPATVCNEDPCIQGLPTFETLKALSDRCVALQQSNSSDSADPGTLEDIYTDCISNERNRNLYIMPYINFTCDGKITRWMAGGVTDTSLPPPDGKAMPRLMVWRAVFEDLYTTVHEIPLLNCNGEELITAGTDLYECSLSAGVEVQSGDLLGVVQNPPSFSLYFNTSLSSLTSGDLPTYRFGLSRDCLTLESTAGRFGQVLPLVALEVQQTDKEQHLTEPDTETLSPPTGESSRRSGQVPVGSLVGAVVPLLLVIIGLLLLTAVQCYVIVRWRGERRKQTANIYEQPSIQAPRQQAFPLSQNADLTRETLEHSYTYTMVRAPCRVPNSRESVPPRTNKANVQRSASVPVLDTEFYAYVDTDKITWWGTKKKGGAEVRGDLPHGKNRNHKTQSQEGRGLDENGEAIYY